MKCVNAVKQVGVLQSLILAGLVMASAGAQASVTLTNNSPWYGDLIVFSDTPLPGYYPNIEPPATSLNASSASSYVSGTMNYQIGSNAGNFSENDSGNVGSPVEIGLESKGYAYQAKASGEAGLLQARAETKMNSGNGNGNNIGSSYADASSTWSDWFVISGGTGESTASFVSLLDGMMNLSKNASAGYGLNISYTTGAYCYAICGESDQSQTVFSQSSSVSGKGKTTLSQDIEGEFTFAYDKPFQLTATLNVGASNGGTADFSLTSLTSSLVLPAGVQLVSASGYFAQAVPEPETYAMMLAGLGLVGFAARRRVAV